MERLSYSKTSTNLVHIMKLAFCNRKSTMKHQQNQIQSQTSHDSVLDVGSACFVDSLTECIACPNCVDY